MRIPEYNQFLKFEKRDLIKYEIFPLVYCIEGWDNVDKDSTILKKCVKEHLQDCIQVSHLLKNGTQAYYENIFRSAILKNNDYEYFSINIFYSINNDCNLHNVLNAALQHIQNDNHQTINLFAIKAANNTDWNNLNSDDLLNLFNYQYNYLKLYLFDLSINNNTIEQIIVSALSVTVLCLDEEIRVAYNNELLTAKTDIVNVINTLKFYNNTPKIPWHTVTAKVINNDELIKSVLIIYKNLKRFNEISGEYIKDELIGAIEKQLKKDQENHLSAIKAIINRIFSITPKPIDQNTKKFLLYSAKVSTALYTTQHSILPDIEKINDIIKRCSEYGNENYESIAVLAFNDMIEHYNSISIEHYIFISDDPILNTIGDNDFNEMGKALLYQELIKFIKHHEDIIISNINEVAKDSRTIYDKIIEYRGMAKNVIKEKYNIDPDIVGDVQEESSAIVLFDAINEDKVNNDVIHEIDQLITKYVVSNIHPHIIINNNYSNAKQILISDYSIENDNIMLFKYPYASHNYYMKVISGYNLIF